MGTGMLLLFISMIVHQLEAMIVKHYGKKYGAGGMFFNAIICFFSIIYFIVTDKGGFEFPPQIIILGLINSVMYAVGYYTAYLAFRAGSFGLTRLFTSFGVIITILYGVVFLKEKITTYTLIAIVLIIVSLFLMNYQKNEESKKTNISLKWIVFVLLVVFSNALITILGRIQFEQFGDTYKNEFLIISLAGASLLLFVLGSVFEREKFKSTIKSGFLYGMFAGVFSAINNLLSLIIYNYVPLSFSAPVKTGLGIVISFMVSVFLYKEKFSRRQITGVVMGIIAVVLINLK